MTAPSQYLGDALDQLADVCRDFDIPVDLTERRTRWLLGRVQVAQVELANLESRLIARAVNATPQPKTPASPPPKPPAPPPKDGR